MAALKVYFTQIDPIDDAVRSLLEQAHLEVIHCPMRTVKFLAATLPAAQEGLVVSSKQAARWLIGQGRTIKPPIFAVGQVTSNMLKDAGFLIAWEHAPANSEELVARMASESRQSLTYLKSPTSRPTIPLGLREFGFAVSERNVYETVAIPPPIDLEWQHLVYFQAPSTVRDYRSAGLHRPRLIAAIGPTTSAALSDLNWSVDFAPTRPEGGEFAEQLVHWLKTRKELT